MNLVRCKDLYYVGQHVIESVSRVRLWIKFTPVELVKVTWQFGSGGPIHRLQLPFHLTPKSLYGVAVCSSIRVDEVFRMVDHQVDVTYIAQVKVWRELVRNDHGARFNELAH